MEPTDEQFMIRNTVARIATEQIAPGAAEMDASCEYRIDIFG